MLPYTIIAVRRDEKMQSVRHSALIAVAKARIWESEGWHVVIADPDGRECDPAQFEQRDRAVKAEDSSADAAASAPLPDDDEADHEPAFKASAAPAAS